MVRSMFDFDNSPQENEINLGIMPTSGSAAAGRVRPLHRPGHPAVWNFAPVELVGPSWMCIENVHLSDSLYTLTYRANEM